MTTPADFDAALPVTWFRDFPTALAEAQRTGKRLFIESGRAS